MAQRNLQLIAGKEPARTSMLAMSEPMHLGRRLDELKLHLIAGLLPQAIPATAVVRIRIRVQFSIAEDARRDDDHGALFDDDAARQPDVLGRPAPHREGVGRVEALALLEGGIHEAQVPEAGLLPAVGADDGDDLLAQLGDEVRVGDEVEEDVGQRHGGGVDGGDGQGELREDGVVFGELLLLGYVGEPLQRVGVDVVWAQGVLPGNFLFDYLGSLFLQLVQGFDLGNKAQVVHDRLEELWVLAQALDGHENCASVVPGNADPLGVTAKLVSEKDACGKL